ncbi:DUF6607 family protein [Coralloluteibacterium thermophilus]|uniref:DUF6607 family protein n=1 Tax=Coralloluteibacterium thermophilum TaxID=2707049 RepID=A0ABV9NLK2_9GAMM
MSASPLHVLLPLALAAVTGCAAAPEPRPAPPAPAGDARPAADPARDRAAILAMQGEYEVDFDFAETVLLAEGYERRPAMRSGGNEVVIVVEDSPTRIVLQHILVSDGGHVTKHWRQDWEYEARARLEFSSDQTWTLRPLAPDATRGAWTQCVYEVSDAPRYCGTGRWNHRYGVATWTSDRSWRPLPRREYTKRDDYNALNVENRHTIVPGGWTHEQDNTKVVRAADGATVRTLAREFGFNDYRRTREVDFGPTYAYWQATSAFWERVRDEWQRRAARHGGLRLAMEVDGMALIVPLFEEAERIQAGGALDEARIVSLFDDHVVAPDAEE